MVLIMSSKDEIKALNERQAFEQFLSCLNVAFSRDSIQSRIPPEPDILFRGANGNVSFEIMQVCSAEMKQDEARLLQGGRSKAVWCGDPNWDVFGEKLRHDYKSSHPVELLCYLNAGTPMPLSEVRNRLQTEIDCSTANFFRRIWLFGENSVHKLFELDNASHL
jgi:hypothetical protein